MANSSGSGKGEWHTPVSISQNLAQVWSKLEALPKEQIQKALENANAKTKCTEAVGEDPQKNWSEAYDNFYAYSKVFPLWDPRKTKDNSQYLPDLRENIYEQEFGVERTLPMVTSMMYGYMCCGRTDLMETQYRVQNSMGDFYRRSGTQ